MPRFKYVGGSDAVDLAGVGTVRRDETFDTDIDLSGRPDFEAVAAPKTTTKKEG